MQNKDTQSSCKINTDIRWILKELSRSYAPKWNEIEVMRYIFAPQMFATLLSLWVPLTAGSSPRNEHLCVTALRWIITLRLAWDSRDSEKVRMAHASWIKRELFDALSLMLRKGHFFPLRRNDGKTINYRAVYYHKFMTIYTNFS